MTKKDIIAEIHKKLINPELFTFRKWDAGAPAFITANFWETAIGFCEANRLTMRPRTSGYAIMFERNDFEDVWCHLEEDFLDTFVNMTPKETLEWNNRIERSKRGEW